MGGFFGVASSQDCIFDLFFGVDYHSHLGTRRGGMAVLGEKGFNRAIHNICILAGSENIKPFMTTTGRHYKEISHCNIFILSNNRKLRRIAF